ncbi:CoA transferase [Nocardioides caeni]
MMGSMPPPPPTPRASEVGRQLLTALGYGGLPVSLPDRTPLEDWAESGLMDLTRDTAGRPLRPRGVPATVARGAAAALVAVASERFGRSPAGGELDGAHLLAERAALAVADGDPGNRHLRRPSAAVSHGGRARFVPAYDGWWVLHLARESDVELVPALVEAELPGHAGTEDAETVEEAWAAVEQWSAGRPVAEVVERAVLLGLPAAAPGETPAGTVPWSADSRSALGRPTRPGAPARVVALGALWAGPLAAQLLGEAGFEVVHVESVGRPDASRWGDPGLHELLHRGSEQVRVDFGTSAGRAELHALVSSADVVVEASRPRALEGLGVAPRHVLGDGRARTWLQLTGHGPDQALRVGFGDDAAVAGGLVAEHPDGTPAFCGDALADPLGGLAGALAVAALHRPDRTTRVAVSLAGVAAYCRSAGDVTWPAVLPAAGRPRHR